MEIGSTELMKMYQMNAIILGVTVVFLVIDNRVVVVITDKNLNGVRLCDKIDFIKYDQYNIGYKRSVC